MPDSGCHNMNPTCLTHVKLKNFTVFDELDLPLSSGINVFVGENGTGKTHLLKVLYAATESSREDIVFTSKLSAVFSPRGGLGALLPRKQDDLLTKIKVKRTDDAEISAEFDRKNGTIGIWSEDKWVSVDKSWRSVYLESTYIPAKEILAHAPGFIAISERRELSFEQIYTDILKKAYLPKLKGEPDPVRKQLLNSLQECINGSVAIEGESFYLRDAHGSLEFSMVAEGLRKLALIWLLIQNGSLGRGSILFWDEPEANLNLKLIKTVVDTLLKLCHEGVQIFIATHSYFVLKELDILGKQDGNVMYHSMYRNNDGGVSVSSSSDYRTMNPNVISDVFADMYDRDIRSSI
jgi:energy-coupling factor transporter ATP-binding protein EcfA2